MEMTIVTENPLNRTDKNVINRVSDVEMNSNSSDISSVVGTKYSCLRDFIVKHHDLYRLTCITGILKPSVNENSERSLSKYNIRWRMWNYYLHTGLALGTLALILVGTEIFVNTNSSDDTLKFCEFYGIVLQHFFLYPAVLYLRNELVVPREIDEALYLEAFQYSYDKVKWVFSSLLVLSFVFYGTDSSLSGLGYYGTFIFILYATFLTPALFFLVGLLTFLIVEQRISYHTMERVSAEVRGQTLTLDKYFEARESIDCRDKLTPINLLIFAAITNTVIGIVLIFCFAGFKDTTAAVLFGIVYVMSNFGRQTVILVIILWEIIRVNDVAEHIIKAISKQRWPTRDLEEERVSVFIAAKEHPIGSTIFFYRPTKFDMQIQIASACIGVVTAVFWALLFA